MAADEQTKADQRTWSMSGRTLAATALLLAMMGAGVGVLPGCGGGGDEAEADAAQTPAVDPKYATADAFVETWNGVISRRHGLDDLLPLIRFEGPEQRQMGRVMRAIEPFLRLEQECFEAFDQCMTPGQQPPFDPNQPPLTITERSDVWARASQQGAGGTKTYDLVFANDRWWIDGAAYVRSPIHVMLTSASDTIHMRSSIDSARTWGDCAKEVLSEVRRGEIASVMDARRRFASLVESRM